MRALSIMLAVLLAMPAAAQDSAEARLRESLRRATTDLRALQDGQAALQARATAAEAQRDRLQAELVAQAARLAELEARPTEPPPELVAELEALRAAARALQQQNAQLAQALTQWQAAYTEAAGVARQKEAERLGFERSLTAARAGIDAAEAKNNQLFATANDILKLYETQDFRQLLLRSYEPLLGLWRVRLENIVQDNEDRIREGRFYRTTAVVPPPPEVSPVPASLAARPQRPARRAAPANANR